MSETFFMCPANNQTLDYALNDGIKGRGHRGTVRFPIKIPFLNTYTHLKNAC